MNGKRFKPILPLVLLLVMFASALPAGAHGGITVDGSTGDWCFPALLPGPDTRATISCPGPSPTGSEVVWDDATGDLSGSVDIEYLATTADPANVYFDIGFGFGGSGPPPPHFQIAIDVAPGIAPISWFTLNPPPMSSIGFSIGMFPDYLLTTDLALSLVTLWESITVPGMWTPVGQFPIGVSLTDLEFAVPWAAFAPIPFGPGSTAYLTLMASVDGGGGAPATPAMDVISESVAGTWTTTCNSCPFPGTACELADNSADAYIEVSYAGPTAVALRDVSVNGVRSLNPTLATAALLACALTGVLVWRRQRPS